MGAALVGAGSVLTGPVGAGSVGAVPVGAGSVGAGPVGVAVVGAGSVEVGSVGAGFVEVGFVGSGTDAVGLVGLGAAVWVQPATQVISKTAARNNAIFFMFSRLPFFGSDYFTKSISIKSALPKPTAALTDRWYAPAGSCCKFKFSLRLSRETFRLYGCASTC